MMYYLQWLHKGGQNIPPEELLMVEEALGREKVDVIWSIRLFYLKIINIYLEVALREAK